MIEISTAVGVRCDTDGIELEDDPMNDEGTVLDRNHRIVLASRPKGAPTMDDFRADDVHVPVPDDGQGLLRNLQLSLVPNMRGGLGDAGPTPTPSSSATSSMALEGAPAAFIGLLEGRNFGKSVASIAES